MKLSRLVLWVCVAGTGLSPIVVRPAVAATTSGSSTRASLQKDSRQPHAADPKINAEALALQDFKKRIDGYVALHKRIAKETPPLKQTDDASKIKTAQETLSGKIRAARADAKPGDIFTPKVRAQFRRILQPELTGEDGRDAKKVLKDDAPEAVPLKVNAVYPAGAALPTVPSKLLLNLPQLPEELEYRIIDKHLILRDTKANIIVDFVPNAIR
jgi:hypothetical protein